MATIARSCLPFMLSLTYPDGFSRDPQVYKGHLRAWFKRLQREYPAIAALWKLEFQQRGAPHFHLFLWGVPWDSWATPEVRSGQTEKNLLSVAFFQEFESWCRQSWFEVVSSGDPRHLSHGIKFEAIRSPQGVMRYVAGYMSKDDQTLPGQRVGRYWGVHNKPCVPFVSEPEREELPEVDFFALRRQARRQMFAQRMVAFHAARRAGRKPAKPKRQSNPSMCLICDAEQWFRRMPAIIANRRWWLDQQVKARHFPSLRDRLARFRVTGRRLPESPPEGPMVEHGSYADQQGGPIPGHREASPGMPLHAAERSSVEQSPRIWTGLQVSGRRLPQSSPEERMVEHGLR